MIRSDLYVSISKDEPAKFWIEFGTQPVLRFAWAEIYDRLNMAYYRIPGWRKLDDFFMRITEFRHVRNCPADSQCSREEHWMLLPFSCEMDCKSYFLTQKEYEKVARFEITEEQHNKLTRYPRLPETLTKPMDSATPE